LAIFVPDVDDEYHFQDHAWSVYSDQANVNTLSNSSVCFYVHRCFLFP